MKPGVTIAAQRHVTLDAAAINLRGHDAGRVCIDPVPSMALPLCRPRRRDRFLNRIRCAIFGASFGADGLTEGQDRDPAATPSPAGQRKPDAGSMGINAPPEAAGP